MYAVAKYFEEEVLDTIDDTETLGTLLGTQSFDANIGCFVQTLSHTDTNLLLEMLVLVFMKKIKMPQNPSEITDFVHRGQFAVESIGMIIWMISVLILENILH